MALVDESRMELVVMLMMEHKTDIDHILEELEEIRHLDMADDMDNMTLERTKSLATDILTEFNSLLHSLEVEEFEHNGIVYDSKLIEDMSMIAYNICLYGYGDLFEGNLSLEETCIKAGEILGCHPEAILNMKLMYDEYFTNIRNGWAQTKELSNDMMLVMRVCDNMTEDEVMMACKRILGFWK